MGSKYPRDIDVLKRKLDLRVSKFVTHGSVHSLLMVKEETIKGFIEHRDFLHAMGELRLLVALSKVVVFKVRKKQFSKRKLFSRKLNGKFASGRL